MKRRDDEHFNDENVVEIDLKTLKKKTKTNNEKINEIANDFDEKFEFVKNTNTFSNKID